MLVDLCVRTGKFKRAMQARWGRTADCHFPNVRASVCTCVGVDVASASASGA